MCVCVCVCVCVCAHQAVACVLLYICFLACHYDTGVYVWVGVVGVCVCVCVCARARPCENLLVCVCTSGCGMCVAISASLHVIMTQVCMCVCVCVCPCLFLFVCLPEFTAALHKTLIYTYHCSSAAQNLQVLKSLGVTHVVNASQGTKFNQVNTDADFYKDAAITFHGIKALDIMTFKILPHLRPAAEFIHQARQANGLKFVLILFCTSLV